MFNVVPQESYCLDLDFIHVQLAYMYNYLQYMYNVQYVIWDFTKQVFCNHFLVRFIFFIEKQHPKFSRLVPMRLRVLLKIFSITHCDNSYLKHTSVG